MFNIPMKTSGALSADDLLSLNQTGTAGFPENNVAQAQTANNRPVQNPSFQNNYQQSAQNQGFQNNYQQPVQNQSVQNNYQQPVRNQPVQNNFQQPVQNSQPIAPKQRPQGTGVRLKKGQKTSLSQMNPNLSEIQVCLGWDILNHMRP